MRPKHDAQPRTAAVAFFRKDLPIEAAAPRKPTSATPSRINAASKAAVRNFARGWTMELKDRKIRVNSMSPGPIETPALEKVGLSAEQVEQAAAQFVSRVPLGRRGKAEEIAAAVLFLASDESSYITGVDLAVDGGMAQV